MHNNDSIPSASSPQPEPPERTGKETDSTPAAQNTRISYPEDILSTPLFNTLNQLNRTSMVNHPLMQTLAALNESPAVKAMEIFKKELAANRISTLFSVQENTQAFRIMHQISESVGYYDGIIKSLTRQAIPAANVLNRIITDYRIGSRIAVWPSSAASQTAIQLTEQMQKILHRTIQVSQPLEKTFNNIVEQGYLSSVQYELAIRCWEDALAGLTQRSDANDSVDVTASYVAENPAQYEPKSLGSPSPENSPDEFSSLLSNDSLADKFKALPLPVQMFISWFFGHIVLGMIDDCIKAAMLDGINAVKTEFASPSKPLSVRKSTIIASQPDIHWEQLNQFRLITGANVRLRTSPSMNSETIEMLNKGTVVAVMETQGRQWLYVQVDFAGEKVHGWLNRSYTSRLRN